MVREIGHATVELDTEWFASHHRAPDDHDTGDGRDIDGRGIDDPFASPDPLDDRLALLVEAIDSVASERDRQVVRQYLLQQAYGDPSPSHTVADDFDLTPENVRQIVSRVRRRLRQLPDDDDRYRLLGEVAWLAA